MYHATIGKLSLIINLMTYPKGSGYLSVLGNLNVSRGGAENAL